MNSLARYFAFALTAIVAASSALVAQTRTSAGSEGRSEYPSTSGMLASIPPSFIENQGQWPSDIAMLVQGKGYNLWVKKGQFIYDLFRVEQAGGARIQDLAGKNGPHADMRRVGQEVRMNFEGASGESSAQGLLPRDGYTNYFLGNDPAHWAAHVPTYEEARISRLYSGIDAMLRFENGEIRYDLLLSPGADPSVVKVRYEGAESVTVDPSGDLVLGTSMGELHQRKPYAYQMDGDAQRAVACNFTARADGSVAFVLGNYDRTRPLVIDPLIYSTVMGGGAHDAAYDMKVDAQKNIYLTGWTFSPRFPVAPGAYSEQFSGDSAYSNLFVTKINSENGKVMYSTFIGGKMNDVANAMELDNAGNVYLTGSTESSNYPTTSGAYDTVHNSPGVPDVFVTKLSADGAKLLYSTFIGGNKSDQAYALALDSLGNVYVGGSTYSGGYPTTRPAFDTLINDSVYADAFVSKLSANGTQLLYSTFIGGNQNDQINDMAVDKAGQAYICGGTWSTNFPLTPNALRRQNQTSVTGPSAGFEQDGFVSQLAADGTRMMFSTYLGGSRFDVANGLIIDSLGQVIVCGETRSMNFPLTKTYDTTNSAEKKPDAFVTWMDVTAGRFLRSVVIGGSGEDVAYDVTMNRAGSLAIAGISNSTDFPTTLGAYETTHGDTTDIDGFFALLDSSNYTVNYATFIGGDRNDFIHAIAIDADHDVYIAGATASTDYPTTTGPYVQSGGGATSVLVSRFSFRPASISSGREVAALVSATIAPNPTHGLTRLAIPYTDRAQFRDGATIALFNSLGQTVREATGGVMSDGLWGAELDLRSLPAGTYYGRVLGSSGTAAFGPIVVVR